MTETPDKTRCPSTGVPEEICSCARHAPPRWKILGADHDGYHRIGDRVRGFHILAPTSIAEAVCALLNRPDVVIDNLSGIQKAVLDGVLDDAEDDEGSVTFTDSDKALDWLSDGQRFKGRVMDAGGGEVRLWWERTQTVDYPPVGADVIVYWEPHHG